MRLRFLTLALMTCAALVLCWPASAQYVQGQVELTYDSSDQTVQIFADTDCDTAIADTYQMWLMIDVFAQDSSGNSTLIYHNRWSAVNGDSMIATPDGLAIDAYPEVTYSATATHGFFFSITDPALGVTYFDDPYGFSAMSLVDTNVPSVRVSPEIPYLYYVVMGATFASGKALAKTRMQLAPTPPASLNLTRDGVFIIQNGLVVANQIQSCPGVNLATSAPSASGVQLPCAFFGFVSGDPTQTPQVPRLQAWLTGVNRNLPVAWSVIGFRYARPDSGYRVSDGQYKPCDRAGTAPQPYEDDGAGLSWATTGSDSSNAYDISTNLGYGQVSPNTHFIKGGIIGLTWQLGNSAARSYNIGLWGTDPDRATVKSRLAQSPLGAPWWREYMVQQESGWHQFNVVAGLKGTPVFGDPCGFGLTQQDPPGQHTSPWSYFEDVWNWQVNLDSGISTMLEMQDRGKRLWDAAVRAWINDPNRPKRFPCNTQIADYIFCYEVKPGVKSYADANAIKLYNGGGAFIMYGDPNNNPNNMHWYLTDGTYISKVLNQSILP